MAIPIAGIAPVIRSVIATTLTLTKSGVITKGVPHKAIAMAIEGTIRGENTLDRILAVFSMSGKLG